jgi:energy-coupling factor transporter ATP-binding protein EcfA2
MGLREKWRWSQELLETVGLWEHRHHRLAQLSGGQQQRVAIALSLANKPKLLLGDEPTGEVDSATAQEILALFREMNKQYGLTTIIVTHDPQIARVVDRVITIRDGRTSSEAIRRVADVEAALTSSALAGAEVGDTGDMASLLDEYVVVDGAGRLQIPPEMRENSGIGKRVVLESMEDGILIKPVVDVTGVTLERDEPGSEEMPELKPRGLRRWFWSKRS